VAQISLPVTGLALAGLILVLLGIARLRKVRILAAGSYGLAGALLLLAAGLLLAFAINLHTYQRLTHEQPLAELTFRQIAPQHYEVSIAYPNRAETHRYELHGDEWQIDARILKWHGLANLLGLDAQYRLERLSGRYQSITEERSHPRSVYPLANQRGLDLWEVAQRYNHWLPWVDAIYGSAAYLPMANDAQFQVSITQSGLIARQVNSIENPIIREWP